MSQRIEVSTLVFDGLTKEVPSSVEEFDQLAKKQGAALESAIMNVLYRGTLAKFRAAFVEWLAKETGIARKTRTEGEGEKAKTVPDEKDSVYVDRVIATLSGGDDDKAAAIVAGWQAKAQELMDAAEFNPAESERKGGDGSKLVAKTYINWAKDAIAAGKGQALANLLTQKLGRTVAVDGSENDVMSLAKAIAENEAKIRADRKSAEYGL